MYFDFEIQERAVPKGRPRFGKGHSYTPERTRDFEAMVAEETKKHIPDDWDTSVPMLVSVDFYFNDKRKRDLDNCLKAVTDAMNRIAYDDDSQIEILQAQKVLGAADSWFYVRVETL